MRPLMMGFLLDLLLGDPHSWPHPVRAMGNLINRSENVIRKICPKGRKGELLGGTLLAVWIPAVSAIFSFGLKKTAYRAGKGLGLLCEIIMCYEMLAARSIRDESMKVCRELEKGRTEEARKAVSMIVGRDTANLTEEGIAKAAVETVAENTSDGVAAPMLFMALFGAPGGFFYKAVNTMDSMVGYHNETYEYFGKAAARLDDVMNWIPSRLSGLLMTEAAFLLGKKRGFDGKKAWKVFLRDRKNHKSPNSAQTEAACAGALGLQLAGDAYYFGKLVKKPVIGDDRRKIQAGDIRRANQLMYVTAALTLILSLGIRAGLEFFKNRKGGQNR